MEHLKREAEAAELVPPRAKGGRLVVHAAQVQAPRRSGPGERAPCAAHMYMRQGLHVPRPREGGCFFVPVAQTRWPGCDWGLGRGRGQRMETKAKKKEKSLGHADTVGT